MLKLSRIAGAVAAATLAFAAAGPAIAQSGKAVRLILPFPPGGPTDAVGRIIAQGMTDVVGQTTVPDNRPGAGGNLGLELASKSPPDGNTIVLSSPIISLAPYLYKKLNYQPKDLAPVTMVGGVYNVLVVHPSVPAKSLKDFIALAKNRPGKLNYGSGGVGTTTHLAPEMLQSMAKIKLVHVPYKGSGMAAVALASGEVDALVASVPAVLPLVNAKKLRPLAVLAPERLSTVPDVPTSKEGGLPGWEVLVWYGILVPSGTPSDAVSRLNGQLVKVLNAGPVKQKLAALDFHPMPSTPEAFAKHIESEAVRYGKVVADAKIPKL